MIQPVGVCPKMSELLIIPTQTYRNKTIWVLMKIAGLAQPYFNLQFDHPIKLLRMWPLNGS
jgi:hypothetical protein